MFGDIRRRFRISRVHTFNSHMNGPDRPEHTFICNLHKIVELAVIPHR